ncbi:hypothetical protein OIU79_023271 [Salix purpurea]|uniref:Uncharacterized protein n=1 Tax=Salix purpurea TaxID=77065 RepID=A0A9Q1A946_SALPP|nr:hypothetical protein OIU79_023271 [Salix purpurea]
MLFSQLHPSHRFPIIPPSPHHLTSAPSLVTSILGLLTSPASTRIYLSICFSVYYR